MWRQAELDGRVLTEPQSKGRAGLGIRRIGLLAALHTGRRGGAAQPPFFM